jgi:hypothetical protein
MRPLASLVLLSLALGGCVETHLYSGLPPGHPPDDYRWRWHVSYFFGTTDGSSPYDLDRICPGGWSEIHLAADFFTGVAQTMTLFLYTPNRLTIVCARPFELASPNAVPQATNP